MGRTKQTARVSTGGSAPRPQLGMVARPAATDTASASSDACSSHFSAHRPAIATFIPPPRSLLETSHPRMIRAIHSMVKYPDVDMVLSAAAEKPLVRCINTVAYALLLVADRGDGEVGVFPFEQTEMRMPRGWTHLRDMIDTGLKNCQMRWASPQFPLSLAEHWLTIFREVHPQSQLQLEERGRLRLLAVLDIVCETLIGAACESAMRRNCDALLTVRCSDLLEALSSKDDHEDTADLAEPQMQALPALFAALQEPLATPVFAAELSASIFPCHTPMLQMLADEFAARETILQSVNDAGWVREAAKVNQLAALYAQLQLRPLPLLQQHGIRPLQYYGRVVGSLQDILLNSPHHVLSLELQDCAGKWWPIVIDCPAVADLPNEPRRMEQGTIYLADTGDAAMSWQILASIEYRSAAATQAVVSTRLVWTATLSVCTQRLMGLSLPVCAEHAEPHVTGTTESSTESSSSCTAPAAVPSCDKAQPLSSLCSPGKITAASLRIVTTSDSTHSSAASSSSHSSPSSDSTSVASLEHVLMVALRLVDVIDSFGPLLFSANQPMHLRARFTAQILDVQSQAVNLPLLPTALLQIIGEYVPADLPTWETIGIMNADAVSSSARDLWSTFQQPVDLDTACARVRSEDSEPDE